MTRQRFTRPENQPTSQPTNDIEILFLIYIYIYIYRERERERERK